MKRFRGPASDHCGDHNERRGGEEAGPVAGGRRRGIRSASHPGTAQPEVVSNLRGNNQQ
jgi:hypothetical protein